MGRDPDLPKVVSRRSRVGHAGFPQKQAVIMRVKGRVKSAEPGAQHFWLVGTLCPPAPEFFTPRRSVGFSINHVVCTDGGSTEAVLTS